MANTYTLISSNVLSSSAASVTFSAIPSTYTDLVLRWSARSDASGMSARTTTLTFNGTTSGSYTELRGTGSSAVSVANTALAYLFAGFTPGDGYTTNTFTNVEVYLPNYNVSTNKPVSAFSVLEQNSTTSNYLQTVANLQSQTTPITSVTIGLTANNFISGSSFYLYGIKNS